MNAVNCCTESVNALFKNLAYVFVMVADSFDLQKQKMQEIIYILLVKVVSFIILYFTLDIVSVCVF